MPPNRVWVVDAMNVRGSVPDGWWKDRDGALRRLVGAIAAHRWPDGESVIVVADGREIADLPAGHRGEVELRYAGHSARDAADDEIVDLVSSPNDHPGIGARAVVVVTSDRGLIDRLPDDVEVEGARTFRRRIGT